MKKPWEMTEQELDNMVKQSRDELRAADRIAAPLFAKQLDEEDEELRKLGANKYGELLDPFHLESDDSAHRPGKK